MIGKAIYDLLKNESAIAAEVSDRIYPVVAAQTKTSPYIVYLVVSNQPEYTKDGAEVDTVRLQISIFANQYKKATQIAALVRGKLERFSGNLVDLTIDNIILDNENDLPEDNAKVHHRQQDYMIRILK
jgi:hypothetical protein